MDELKPFIENAAFVTWPVAVVVVGYFLRPFISALASRMTAKSDDRRINDLVEFQRVAETNHFTDLERLLESDKNQWTIIEKIRADLGKLSQDVAWLRGKIGNGHTQ